MKRTEKLNNELTKLTKIGTTVASVAAIALLAEPVLACGMFPPPDVTTPPPTWIKFNPAGQGVGAFGVQLGDPINPQSAIFVPTEKTNCVCGI